MTTRDSLAIASAMAASMSAASGPSISAAFGDPDVTSATLASTRMDYLRHPG
ncbi:MAG: hypothetical protein ACP5UD_05660 [Conexivisphaera sp.]